MSITKDSENIEEILLQITDSISELGSLLEKADVLISDVSVNYLERVSFKTEMESMIAQHDLNIARVKADVVCNYTAMAVKKSDALFKLSNDALAVIKEKCSI